MGKELKYKYVYTDLNELLLKIFTLEDMLKNYKKFNGKIEWISKVYITRFNTYVYKVKVFERVDSAGS